MSFWMGFCSSFRFAIFWMILPPLVRIFIFFGFSICSVPLMRQFKRQTVILLARSSASHGRQRALGVGCYILKLCRFVVDYLQIGWKLWVFCRLFASFLSSVSVLILFNISGLNWFFTIGKECCSSRPWSSYKSTLACYPDARKRFY